MGSRCASGLADPAGKGWRDTAESRLVPLNPAKHLVCEEFIFHGVRADCYYCERRGERVGVLSKICKQRRGVLDFVVCGAYSGAQRKQLLTERHNIIMQI